MTAVIGDLIPSADSFQVDAGFKMRAAQAAIRKHCGWHVAPSVTRTIRLDGHGGDSLLLPSKHVTALSSLKLDGVEHVQDARFSEAGSLVLVNAPPSLICRGVWKRPSLMAGIWRMCRKCR